MLPRLASSVSRNSRFDAVCRLSVVNAPHGLTEAACRVADRGNRPRRRCVNEQPFPGQEIRGDGTARIDASLGSVDVNKTKGYVMDLGAKGPKGDRQLARRVFPEDLGRFNLTSTNQKIDRNVHEHLLRIYVVRAHTLAPHWS